MKRFLKVSVGAV